MTKSSARQVRTPMPGPAAVEPIEPAGRRWAEVVLVGFLAALVLTLVVAAVVVMVRPIGP